MELKSAIDALKIAQEEFNKKLDELQKIENDKLIWGKSYFTPSIRDIRIGYECEVINTKDIHVLSIPSNKWTAYTAVTDWDIWHLVHYLEQDCLRVPLLTGEQIQKEGWYYVKKNLYKKGLIEVRMIVGTVKIYKTIRHSFDCNSEPEVYEHVFFWGECKDINTFRYICKLLNIN